MAYDLTGTILVIQEPQTFASGFSKREFVVTVEEGKYPQQIALECVKEKMTLLDGLQEGQRVKVTFDIRGREHNGRYFNNLQAWRIEPVADSDVADGDRPPLPDDADAPADLDELDGDIPF